MNNYYGEFAALGTSVVWTFTALCFEYAAKRIGTIGLNILRLFVALVIYTIMGIILRGEVIPLNAGGPAWFWLSLSGLVGFVFGDVFLFQAYIYIGARMTQVVFVSSPIITAILGYFVFGEKIAPLGILGMLIVIAAIIFVVLERRQGQGGTGGNTGKTENRTKGIIFAVLAALGQSGGLILSKIGAPSSDPMAATHIRVIAGLAGFLIVAALMRKLDEPIKGLRDVKALKVLSLGSFLGPFAGVTLAMVAVQRTSSGIAATLMGLMPILILIPDSIIKKEKIRPREIIGAGAAVLGAAMIFIH